MKILVMGVYDLKTYGRGRILYHGLKANNAKVELALEHGKWKYLALAERLLRRNYDVILVNGKIALLTTWLMKPFHDKPIVFDTFISDYDTLVLDRKVLKPNSLKARLVWWSDKLSIFLPTLSFLDTKQQVKFYEENFGTNPRKFRVVYVGGDDETFHPTPMPHNKGTVVYWHGSYIPLHGADIIIKAAKLLEKDKSISFHLVGKGQKYEECRKLASDFKLKNIKWEPVMGAHELPKRISKGDISLGNFGASEKAQNVITHKAFDTIASGRPLITCDTRAHREVFTHGKDAWLVKPNDPNALAEGIRVLAKNRKLRERIAKNGLALYRKKYSTKQTGKALISVLKEAIRKY